MDTGEAKKEETIKEQSERLVQSLYVLLGAINTLVERNPRSPEAETGVQDKADNVFDEIVSTLRHCRRLIREATEKVEAGISRKVL